MSTEPAQTNPKRILIAGGGVAGLEVLLALHAQAGRRVRLTLIAPGPHFSYRPMAVAEPFALGRAEQVPLARFAEETGAELVQDAVTGVDDAAGEVRLRDGGVRRFDALLVAPGGRAVSGVPGATTWWPGGDAETYGGLLRDLEEGYSKQLAIVVPPGAVWPLPAYELALMTAGEARAMGQDDVHATVVTPEHTPLTLFGERGERRGRRGARGRGRRARDRRGRARHARRPDARAGGPQPVRAARVRRPAARGTRTRRPPCRRGGLHRRP